MDNFKSDFLNVSILFHPLIIIIIFFLLHIFTVGNLLNIFMEHDLDLIS